MVSLSVAWHFYSYKKQEHLSICENGKKWPSPKKGLRIPIMMPTTQEQIVHMRWNCLRPFQTFSEALKSKHFNKENKMRFQQDETITFNEILWKEEQHSLKWRTFFEMKNFFFLVKNKGLILITCLATKRSKIKTTCGRSSRAGIQRDFQVRPCLPWCSFRPGLSTRRPGFESWRRLCLAVTAGPEPWPRNGARNQITHYSSRISRLYHSVTPSFPFLDFNQKWIREEETPVHGSHISLLYEGAEIY